MPVLALFFSPPLHPPSCVCRVAPSACPLSSPAGTPFRVICAFRESGKVVLQVRSACPPCACSLVLPWRLGPLPPPAFLACALREVALRGADRAVPGCPCPSAFPVRVPCSACLVWGGGWPSLRVSLPGLQSRAFGNHLNAPNRSGAGVPQQSRAFTGVGSLCLGLSVGGWAGGRGILRAGGGGLR